MVVMAADIRRSTFVMKEAVDFTEFAATVSDFVDKTREYIGTWNGWFDKFTGDGFLAYWLYRSDDDVSRRSAAADVLHTSEQLLNNFLRNSIPRLRRNSRNFPSGVGLSIGLDSGPGHFVKIGGDLTVVGSPVVGSVRMSSVAKPWETVANVNLGDFLARRRGAPHVSSIERQLRRTKEYDNQEVYRVTFDGFDAPDVPTDGVSLIRALRQIGELQQLVSDLDG